MKAAAASVAVMLVISTSFFRHPLALEQDVEPELRDRAFIHADRLALEIGKRIDVLLDQHAVAAMVLSSATALKQKSGERYFMISSIVEALPIELAGRDRRHVERGILDDLQIDIEPVLP